MMALSIFYFLVPPSSVTQFEAGTCVGSVARVNWAASRAPGLDLGDIAINAASRRVASRCWLVTSAAAPALSKRKCSRMRTEPSLLSSIDKPPRRFTRVGIVLMVRCSTESEKLEGHVIQYIIIFVGSVRHILLPNSVWECNVKTNTYNDSILGSSNKYVVVTNSNLVTPK